jgi:hypothetical protein
VTKTLVVCIGTGKTGTTSIQEYFLRHRSDLAGLGVEYWGVNFEYVHCLTRRPWQKPDGTGILQGMPVEQAIAELSPVLRQAAEMMQPGQTAVWCNESIYEWPHVYIPLLLSCQGHDGLQIKIVAYARERKSYLVSAYKQWGIKHKTYPGPILSFSDWVRLNQDFLCYGDRLQVWDQAFAGDFFLVNYDSLPDVVADFLSRIPGSLPCLPACEGGSDNASPDAAQLGLYALYNNLQSGPTVPDVIASLLTHYGIEGLKVPPLSISKLCPCSQELDEVDALFSRDACLVDRLLDKHGQPPFPPASHGLSAHPQGEHEALSGVVSLLLAIIVEQDRRLTKLESHVSLDSSLG